MAFEFIPIAMAQLWQVTLLILVVAALSRWLSPRRLHLSHLLWLVVLIKCVTPPLWASPGGVFCWLQPERKIETPFVENIERTPVVWDRMLDVKIASTMDSEFSAVPFAGVYLDEAAEAELTTASSFVEPLSDEPFGSATVVAWAVISGLVLLVVTIRWLRFCRLVRASPRRNSPELDMLLNTLSKQLGVRRRVRLIVTESLVGPAVVGFFRVAVLIPAIVADKLKGDSVAPILAHELLHIRRGDLWVGLLQTVAQALWWFHPLVWWVGRVTTREAERCCDEEVLGELKCDPASYARVLLDVLDLKSQLKPVPVFPGVRPVDVTSQRLERIMTLRQGCRRRSPWWCWMVAIGAAALTLPGAAFVVTAQEEEPRDLTGNEDSKTFPAPPACVGPGPFPPMPLPRDAELTAYSICASNETPTTEVYNIAEFSQLLSGTEAEKQQKFERLVQSRDAARAAKINWYNGPPVVNTTTAGHASVRQCVGILLNSGATSGTIDAFLDSVTENPKSVLVCNLQMITTNDDVYSDLENSVSVNVEEHDDSISWVMSADKWDALVKAIPSHNGYSFVAPQLTVFNGGTVMAEGVAQHGISLKRDDDGRLHPCINWSGWKSSLLPFQRDDGSFWLGMWLENGTVVGKRPLPPEHAQQFGVDVPVTVHAYRELKFAATPKVGQVMVLPGLKIDHGHDTPRSTFLTARIRRVSTNPGLNAVPNPRHTTGTAVKSDAGVKGDILLESQPAASPPASTALEATVNSDVVQQVSNLTPVLPRGSYELNAANSGRRLTTRPFGSLTLEVTNRGGGTSAPRMLISIKTAAGQDVLAGTAGGIRIRSTPNSEIIHLEEARLQRSGVPSTEIVARRLTIEANRNAELGRGGRLLLQIQQGEVRVKTGSDFSNLKAERIELTVSPTPFVVEGMSADGLGSLRTSANVEVNSESVGTPGLKHDKTSPSAVVAKLDGWESPLRHRDLKSGNLISVARTTVALETRVSPRFTEAPLSEVVEWARNSTDLNIAIEQGGLEEEGVTLATPVSIELNDVSLKSVFRLILEPLHLGLKIDHESGVVIVTSKLRQMKKMITAVYSVADLVVPVTRPPAVRFDSTKSASTGQSIASTDRVAEFDKLVELIQQTVEPDSWHEAGGAGTIRTNKTTLSLVIRQTDEVHQEISDLLGQLRRLQNRQVVVATASLILSPDLLENVKFEMLDESNKQRFAILSEEQAMELRNAGKLQSLPRVTLFNGQKC